MKMIDQKWEDLNGRKHKLYVVRSMGAGRGFGVIEVLRNFVVTTGSTREECYEYLRTTDADDKEFDDAALVSTSGKQETREGLLENLFNAVRQLSELDEIEWEKDDGMVSARITLWVHEAQNDQDDEVGLVGIGSPLGPEQRVESFATEAAQRLHDHVRSKHGW